MPATRLMTFLLTGGLPVTILLVWFAVSSYYSALPVAQGIQRGLALSLGQAIESLATRDPSLQTLQSFRAHDLAYFALIDRRGVIRLHSNPELVGERVDDQRYRPVFELAEAPEYRVRLGTGEEVYEHHQALHLGKTTLALRLALHSWQADQVVRRARSGLLVVLVLTVAAWGFALFSFRLIRKDMARREEMARREHLVHLGELGAVLAHEVRTPLAGIKGYAQLLGERAVDERSGRFAGMIVGEVARLEELVNDLLVYARQEGGRGGSTVVEQAVHSAWELIAEQARQQGVVLAMEGDGSVRVACQPEQMRQLLLNLFANALSVQPSGGTVLVTVTRERRRVVGITVSDNGPGFSEEALGRCFDPFFTTRASGSGLGLAICRTIVDACGGEIMVQNRHAGGAAVVCRLPESLEERG
ncbi:ATP-binding protein [Trichlorobacter ammonificans]|uniref:histidine kinase n=1 Tax=Trichlorobacter ammonificans TaxID=2916410 RepID=A0ABM9D5L7_9BACT|nr:ATP-binding protein [Trichlorobacter ammonificans]CAH2030456.1 Histidine kinase [Trichlorobacter ammonificans]